VIKNADPALPWNRSLDQPEENEIPPELQKPKADNALTLVNFTTVNQRKSLRGCELRTPLYAAPLRNSSHHEKVDAEL